MSEHVDVLVVGPGCRGSAPVIACRPNARTAVTLILEARDTIGGTWDLFRYPGVRSDSDMFTLGYPFRPWTRPQAIADGETILEYIRETAAAFGIDTKIRYGQRVVSADWSTPTARWTVTHRARATSTPARSSTSAPATTATRAVTRSTSRGWTDFGGPIVHPQHWPADLDYKDKRVVVIGSGATAVTLVPAMAAHGRPRDDAAALSQLHDRPAGPGRQAKRLGRVVSPTTASRIVRGRNVLIYHGPLPGVAALAGEGGAETA